jgi:dTDP-4-dehydrorhamnose reductase
MKKILVIGIKGMAGHVVFKSLSNIGKYEVYGVARNIPSTDRIFNLDVSNTEDLKKIIELKFDIIINCIGILNKDAEENPDKAIWFNSYFPHLLESITKNSNTKVITISTDCVFSGKKGNYTELDFRDGDGFYARSKAMGELINEKDLTIRTSIIGPELNKEGIGLFNWISKQKGEINGFTNAYWSGVTTVELAKFINKTINDSNFPTGLIHLTNNTKISKYNLLCIIKEVFELDYIKINESGVYKVDKSFISTRKDIEDLSLSYKEMILEMKNWIENTNKINKN